MGTKREEYRLRGGDILEIREFHDGRYGAPGQKREKRENQQKSRCGKQMTEKRPVDASCGCLHTFMQVIALRR